MLSENTAIILNLSIEDLRSTITLWDLQTHESVKMEHARKTSHPDLLLFRESKLICIKETEY